MDIDGTRNYLADNTVMGNGANYAIQLRNLVNLVLGELPETINVPAMVTLAGTLTANSTNQHGLTISSSDVTVDLGGHSLLGIPGSLAGIEISGAFTNITISNGMIRDWGAEGVHVNINARSCRIAGLSTARNQRSGIKANVGALIENCISDRDCGSANSFDAGILGGDASIVRNCLVVVSQSDGIKAGRGTLIRDCIVRTSNLDGIEVISDCTVVDNLVVLAGSGANDGAAIHVTGAGNRIENNNVHDSDRGIDANPATGSVIVRNSARGNAIEYDIAAGNQAGAISVNPATAGPWDNFDF